MFEAYRLALLSRGLSPHTVRNYLSCVRAFASWWEGTAGRSFDPAAVAPLDVAEYRRRLQNAGRKPATVNLHIDALSSFFSWAALQDVVRVDPAEGVKRVRERRSVPRWLSLREVRALSRAVQKHGTAKDRALLALLLHAGLRVSEAVGLRVQDVVLRERSGHVSVRRGKGSKYREVPLNVTARRMISKWLASHPGGDYLFPGKSGGPVTPRAVQKRLKELGRLAGVDVTPHRLRHTFCKMLVDAGESLDRVAVLAGHSNLNTTAVYTKPGKADLERAVEKLSWD